MTFHDEQVRSLRLTKRVQVDEMWSFTYCKEKTVPYAKKAPPDAGDTWTWTALDADSKLLISWVVGPRDSGSAFRLMQGSPDPGRDRRGRSTPRVLPASGAPIRCRRRWRRNREDVPTRGRTEPELGRIRNAG